MQTLDLANGYYELPPGKLANVATFLDMKTRPARRLVAFPPTLELQRIDATDLANYRTWFKAVGQDLMWFSRVIMPDEQLAAILSHPGVESFALMQAGEFCGLMELDFRAGSECELAFFGLAAGKVGHGLGRTLMDEALRRAWAHPISRLFVHTCTFDHPAALPFYIRSGFNPVSVSVEIHDDPRLKGHLPLTATPQAPLIV